MGFICGSYNATAFDDFDGGGDDYDLGGDDYDYGDADIGDTVIIDDSVNIYDGGGRGKRRGGGDATGAAIMGFMGGMVVNEMMQDNKKPARAAPQPAQASQPRATARAEPTLEQQLEEIESLKQRGILTQSEYNAKRKAIIASY
jgi:hypothetical protein